MFANVTIAQTLARHRAAELDRRNAILRDRAERPAPRGASMVAPSTQGHAVQVMHALHLARTSRPAAVR